MSSKKNRHTILSVVGTRPNFMKVGPLEEQFKTRPHLQHIILHTGQHFDDNMSAVFFRDLELRTPDIQLGIHGGNLGEQTGRIMGAFEKELLKIDPDLVVVVGDVNSTFATAWVAVQNHYPVAHVESGLRSFDRRMPEEINRLCTDVIADLLFTTHPSANTQLIEKEGIAADKVFMVGDIMIDYLVKYRDQAEKLATWEKFGVNADNYALLTLHRPSNVDEPQQLQTILETLSKIAAELPIIFPAHPRTKINLQKFNLLAKLQAQPNIKLCEPLSYLEFLSCMLSSRLVLTDSGGVQEETTFLDIPCMTLRENTERPFCITHGTNYLVGRQPADILRTFNNIMNGNVKHAQTIDCWDGKTAERIAAKIDDYLQNNPK